MATRLLRPLARAADGIAHNRERRMAIRRYRRVACVRLVQVCNAERRGC